MVMDGKRIASAVYVLFYLFQKQNKTWTNI